MLHQILCYEIELGASHILYLAKENQVRNRTENVLLHIKSKNAVPNSGEALCDATAQYN